MSARCNPDCDPRHHAGYFDCDVCGAPIWASEAIWLDGNSILATFTPACGHAEEQVTVVDGGDHP
jgi:hypothetical protein